MNPPLKALLDPASLDGLRRSLGQGHTLPWAWYGSEDVLQLERRALFRPAWQYVGHAGLVDEPGKAFTCRVADTDLLVVRGHDGHLRAFVNACRHRGAQILREACATRTSLQCHYHAWTYDLDGSLRAAPRSDREATFDRSELGLVPAAADLWGPFVFVNLDAGAPPLLEALGDLPGQVAVAGVDVQGLRFHHRADYPLACNWKVAVENFLECYHCQVAHPQFAEVMDTGPDAYQLQAFPRFLTQRAPLRDDRHGAYDARGEVPRGEYHILWPSTKVNVNPGRANLSIGPVLPVDPRHSVGYLDYFFGADVDEAWIADLVAFDDRVGAEDTVLVESVQRGMDGGALPGGRLFLDSEKLIAAFQHHVLDAIARAALAEV